MLLCAKYLHAISKVNDRNLTFRLSYQSQFVQQQQLTTCFQGIKENLERRKRRFLNLFIKIC